MLSNSLFPQPILVVWRQGNVKKSGQESVRCPYPPLWHPWLDYHLLATLAQLAVECAQKIWLISNAVFWL